MTPYIVVGILAAWGVASLALAFLIGGAIALREKRSARP